MTLYLLIGYHAHSIVIAHVKLYTSCLQVLAA